ncbi:MAG: hypothetical protein PHN75_09640 [Syntrophales bacterium]|nr:hypothetical protein [Syntrophales bacterium]
MWNSVLRLAGLVVLALMMIGCASFRASYGTIDIDEAIQARFEAYQHDPDMNYYWSGSEAHPTAIMGLKKAYALDNDLWKPMDPDPKAFTNFVKSMQEIARQYALQQRGFIIKDPQGKAIGVWYSLIQIKPMTVRMGEDNKVNIYTPELFVYPGGKGTEGGRMSGSGRSR